MPRDGPTGSGSSTLDIVAGLRLHVYGMKRSRLLLVVVGLLLLVVSLPIDVLRQQYVWSRLSVTEERQDAYRSLIGHCDCFQRGESGELPPCVRAYSSVWHGSTLLQLLLLLALFKDRPLLLTLLSGAYSATVLLLSLLFVDCGVLTEDDCYIVYYLLPLLLHAAGLLWYSCSSSFSPPHLHKSRTSCL